MICKKSFPDIFPCTMVNDILQILDRRKGAVLLLLDLSAAYDTIAHSILLETIRHEVGITQMDRMFPARQRTDCFHVRIPFSKNTLEMGGPSSLSFRTSFVLHLYNSTPPDHQTTSYHLYADETQLYIELCFDNTTTHADDIRRLERCVADVREWMRTNMLLLNDDKTGLIMFHHKTSECNEVPKAVVVGDSSITTF